MARSESGLRPTRWGDGMSNGEFGVAVLGALAPSLMYGRSLCWFVVLLYQKSEQTNTQPLGREHRNSLVR